MKEYLRYVYGAPENPICGQSLLNYIYDTLHYLYIPLTTLIYTHHLYTFMISLTSFQHLVTL